MKKLLYLVYILLMVFSVASCDLLKGDDSETPNNPGSSIPVNPEIPNYTSALDIHIDAGTKWGITYRRSEYVPDITEVKTTGRGKMLPTWAALSKLIEVDFRETYIERGNSSTTYYDLVEKDFMSKLNPGESIDLLYTTTSNIKDMVRNDNVIDLTQYLDQMPNFSKWLDKNPTIKKQILINEKLYYTPFLNRYNGIEKMFIMNTKLAKLILDAESFDNFDNTINGVGAEPNTLQTAKYTPFIDANYNYPSDITLKVLDEIELKEIIVKKTDNIIKIQNESLALGTTGKELAIQLRSYLDKAYGEYIGEGKLFENYSDIFISDSAVYNVDELIALCRVIKANPGLLTGDNSNEVEIIIPKGPSNSSVEGIADFLQLWGINGMASEKDMLYFTPDGKLADAATTQATYDGLKYLSALYDEGLVLKDFYSEQPQLSNNMYSDIYFAHTKGTGKELAFMLYGSLEKVGDANDRVNGIGTNPNSRVSDNKSVQGIMPILPPYTYWATESTWKTSQSLIDFTGKTLTRFIDRTIDIKSYSWCIPKHNDNIDDAVRLMDYMYSEEGAKVQNFGPSEYWKEESQTLIPGQSIPILSDVFYAALDKSGLDFDTYISDCIGSNQGIGYVKHEGVFIQATNLYAQKGLINLNRAIACGVINSSSIDKYDNGKVSWDSILPATNWNSWNNANPLYPSLISFWEANKCSMEPTGWVAYIVNGCDESVILGNDKIGNLYTINTVLSQLSNKDADYLASMNSSYEYYYK